MYFKSVFQVCQELFIRIIWNCSGGADLIGKYGIYLVVELTKTQKLKSEYKFTKSKSKRLHKDINVKKSHQKLTICTNNP